MDLVLNWIYEYSFLISLYGSLAGIAAFVLVIINTIRTSIVIRKYKRLMRGVDNKNLDELLEHHLSSIKAALIKVDEINQNQTDLFAQVSKCIQGVGVVRYNPFAEVGSDLSFSIALLNAQHNGLVLTGIFGRNSTTTYSKAVTNGKSSYPLSDEEMEAIKIARASIQSQK